MRIFIPLTLLFTASVFVGCSQQQTADTAASDTTADATTTTVAINQNCPIMGSEVADDGGTYDWNGKTVGFCCPECIDAFAEMSDEEKTEALANAENESDEHGEHDHEEHGHDDATES